MTDNDYLLTDNDYLLTDNDYLLTDNNYLLTDNNYLLTDNNYLLTDNSYLLNGFMRAKSFHVTKTNNVITRASPIRIPIACTFSGIGRRNIAS